jgi:hypothetical protein
MSGDQDRPRGIRPEVLADPGAALEALGALTSPDLDAYASGTLDASRVRCVLCLSAPCACPPFGSAAYFALLDARHGRPASPPCDDPACPVTEQSGPHPRGIAIAATGRPSVACIAEPGATR